MPIPFPPNKHSKANRMGKVKIPSIDKLGDSSRAKKRAKRRRLMKDGATINASSWAPQKIKMLWWFLQGFLRPSTIRYFHSGDCGAAEESCACDLSSKAAATTFSFLLQFHFKWSRPCGQDEQSFPLPQLRGSTTYDRSETRGRFIGPSLVSGIWHQIVISLNFHLLGGSNFIVLGSSASSVPSWGVFFSKGHCWASGGRIPSCLRFFQAYKGWFCRSSYC